MLIDFVLDSSFNVSFESNAGYTLPGFSFLWECVGVADSYTGSNKLFVTFFSFWNNNFVYN